MAAADPRTRHPAGQLTTLLHRLGWRLARLLPGWRQAELARWNIKLLGTELARQRYAEGHAGPGLALPPAPLPVGLASRICAQADIEAAWLRHWCGVLHCWPVYHRKLWEDCFVLQALWEAGALAEGKRALGFAVGREALPAVLAAHGAQVTATDLPAQHREARGWQASGQHAAEHAALHYPHVLDRAGFDARVEFRAVDMRRIPADLRGYDALWSVCAFEHLGSRRRGLDFVLAAMDCLRPGGVAVHTTEFNLDPADDGLGRGRTVLYRRADLDWLAARLAERGHEMLALAEPGEVGVMDRFVDLPPYAYHPFALGPLHPPHLALEFRGRAVTSVGVVIRKAM